MLFYSESGSIFLKGLIRIQLIWLLIGAIAPTPFWRQEMEKYYFLKCALFDRVRIEAPSSVIDSSSFTVDSKASVKDALTVVGSSPFKTAFVIDEANKKSIFAITQNIDLVNESRKRKVEAGEAAHPASSPS